MCFSYYGPGRLPQIRKGAGELLGADMTVGRWG